MLTAPGGFARSGAIDIVRSTRVSAVIGGLPVRNRYAGAIGTRRITLGQRRAARPDGALQSNVRRRLTCEARFVS